MNEHDSERMAGVLEENGYCLASDESLEQRKIDLYVINTCAVREHAASRLYGNLGHLADWKKRNPSMQIAVGGCLAQKDRGVIIERAPWVDVVFGTNNIHMLPDLLLDAKVNGPKVSTLDKLTVFPSDVSAVRSSKFSAKVAISVGCNNLCTFCIVPHLRGKERDRNMSEISQEIEGLAADGVTEVMLLGQNVNTYGREFHDKYAFSALLEKVSDIKGIKRIRFMSPHPSGFTPDVAEVMAGRDNIMNSIHMPLQSGSDSILKRMRRGYTASKFMHILDDLRAKMPDIAVTTDIIIGFPAETDADFRATCDVVRDANFQSAFIFNYSPRPLTPAIDYPDQLPDDVKSARFKELFDLQEAITLELNKAQIGKTVEVLVTDEQGKKDAETGRISARDKQFRLIHIDNPVSSARERLMPGDYADVTVTKAAPHHLIGERK
jgi:tRNA-2-methylthio-N6-dimethylallyladenosine synthase